MAGKFQHALSSVPLVGAIFDRHAKHYDDQWHAWRTVQPHPMLWERESIVRDREAILILLPK